MHSTYPDASCLMRFHIMFKKVLFWASNEASYVFQLDFVLAVHMVDLLKIILAVLCLMDLRIALIYVFEKRLLRSTNELTRFATERCLLCYLKYPA
jgi:hypothetical protein